MVYSLRGRALFRGDGSYAGNQPPGPERPGKSAGADVCPAAMLSSRVLTPDIGAAQHELFGTDLVKKSGTFSCVAFSAQARNFSARCALRIAVGCFRGSASFSNWKNTTPRAVYSADLTVVIYNVVRPATVGRSRRNLPLAYTRCNPVCVRKRHSDDRWSILMLLVWR